MDPNKSKNTTNHSWDLDDYYKKIFENMINASIYNKIVLNRNGEPIDFIILDVNKKFLELAGCKKEEVVGSHAMKMFPNISKEPGKWAQRFGEVALKKANFQTEAYFHPLKRWTHVKAFSPKEKYFVAIFEDISQKHETEKHLEIRQKYESITLLAGGLVHDFRNMLGSIIGSLELIQFEESNLSAFQKDLLDNIKEAAEKATSLSEQLLSFSSNGVESKKRIQIANILKKSVKITLPGTKSVAEIRIGDRNVTCFGNDSQLYQVFSNLLLNAAQSMPKGGTIHIRLTKFFSSKENCTKILKNAYMKNGTLSQNKKYAHIVIEDQGKGISQKKIKTIFEPFFTTKKQGTGLGLPVSNSIIRGHNGKMAVQSKPNQGTKFHIFLPLLEKNIKGKMQHGVIPAQKKLEKFDGKILLLEDDEYLSLTIAKQLFALGFNVISTHNSSSAMQEFKYGKPFDLVILDLIIPGEEGGIQTFKEFKKIDPNIKAILSSGSITKEMEKKYKKIGFITTLPKPFGIEELTEALKKAGLKK